MKNQSIKISQGPIQGHELGLIITEIAGFSEADVRKLQASLQRRGIKGVVKLTDQHGGYLVPGEYDVDRPGHWAACCRWLYRVGGLGWFYRRGFDVVKFRYPVTRKDKTSSSASGMIEAVEFPVDRFESLYGVSIEDCKITVWATPIHDRVGSVVEIDFYSRQKTGFDFDVDPFLWEVIRSEVDDDVEWSFSRVKIQWVKQRPLRRE